MASPARSHSVHINAITGTGPGLLESAYQACLAHELRAEVCKSRLKFRPVVYEGEKLEVGYRIDLIVEGRVIVEVKSVSRSTQSTKPNFCPTGARVEFQ